MFIISPWKVRSDYYNNFQFEFNGQVFKSIKKCCSYYGISYRSVKQRKSDTGCSAEESIQYYIDLKNSQVFIFRNRKWNNIKSCCAFYGLNEASVKNTMWGNHISILYYIKKKEKEELIGPIEYDGVQYPSITACCHEYGVSPYTATSYIRKHECKVNDALKICIMNKQKRENYFFVYDGSSYTSLADCCKKLGVNKASVVSRKYRLGCSYDEAIDHFLNNKNTEV